MYIYETWAQSTAVENGLAICNWDILRFKEVIKINQLLSHAYGNMLDAHWYFLLYSKLWMSSKVKESNLNNTKIWNVIWPQCVAVWKGLWIRRKSFPKLDNDTHLSNILHLSFLALFSVYAIISDYLGTNWENQEIGTSKL